MSKTDKLIEKLKRGKVDARELRNLMEKMGFSYRHGKGSHEYWSDGARIIVLSSHSKELKQYQIRAAAKVLLPGDDHGEEN